MGDKDPKSIDKLREQAEAKKEEALEYKHETPDEKAQDHEREDASADPEPTEEPAE